jgi:hypothetical protein
MTDRCVRPQAVFLGSQRVMLKGGPWCRRLSMVKECATPCRVRGTAALRRSKCEREYDVIELVVRRYLSVVVRFRNAALPVYTQLQCDDPFALHVAVGTNSFSTELTWVEYVPPVVKTGVAL